MEGFAKGDGRDGTQGPLQEVTIFFKARLWRWNADGVRAAGADRAAGDRPERLVHADLDGGEIVVAATERKTVARKGGIGLREEVAGFFMLGLTSGRWTSLSLSPCRRVIGKQSQFMMSSGRRTHYEQA